MQLTILAYFPFSCKNTSISYKNADISYHFPSHKYIHNDDNNNKDHMTLNDDTIVMLYTPISHLSICSPNHSLIEPRMLLSSLFDLHAIENLRLIAFCIMISVTKRNREPKPSSNVITKQLNKH